MVKIYNKLVRDRIPEIIERSGGWAETEILSHDAYLAALEAKLSEEMTEYLSEGSLDELCDLLEVIYALAEARGHTKEALETLRAEKAAERGGFSERIFLKTVKEG